MRDRRRFWQRGASRRAVLPLVAVLLAAAVVMVPRLAPADGAATLTAVSLDESSGDCKAAGDLSGDGRPDGVLGGASLAWYRAGATETDPFTQFSIQGVADVEFSTDCQLADVDADGDPDIVVPDGPTLYWYANPRPSGDPASAPWTRRQIGAPGNWTHDVEVADMNGDGRIDVVTRQSGRTDVWVQTSPTSWTRLTPSSQGGEGTALGDIDGDGDIDIVQGGNWIEHPDTSITATPAPTWTAHAVTAIGQGPIPVADRSTASVTVADLNGDGRQDIVYGPLESVGSKLAWYESVTPRSDPTWVEHLISPVAIPAGMHTFKVGDMDNDGDLDLVTARMHTYAPSNVSVWNNLGSAMTWSEQVVDTTGMHNLRLADFGADGDLDIFGSNFVGTPPLRLYRNETTAPTTTTTAPTTTTTSTAPTTTTSTAPTTTTSTAPTTTTTTAPTTTTSTAPTTTTTVPAGGCSAGTRCEAELAGRTSSWDVETGWCPCSNNAAVGSNLVIGEALTFSMSVPSAGSYTLSFAYTAGGGATTRSLVVNGAAPVAVTFPGTSGWKPWATYTVTTSLRAGLNTVVLRLDTSNGRYLNLDYVVPSPTGTTTTTTTPPTTTTAPPTGCPAGSVCEAEAAVRSGGATRISCSACSAGAAVRTSSSGQQVTFTVVSNRATTSRFNIGLRYRASQGSATRELQVNGATVGTVTFPSSSGFTTVVTNASLNPGANTITIRFGTGSSRLLDLDWLQIT